MRFDILTLFPEMFSPVLGTSMLGRAAQNGLLEFQLHNIRDYSTNKHKTTDDYPFGGGAGMVMTAQPVYDCIEAVTAEGVTPRRIYMSPRGRVLSSKIACELAKEPRLLILCGHYEGIDERILTLIDDQISIGDYVLTGGELPAMVLIDCISRFVPGVLGHSESALDESFCEGLLEYPHYTRPAEFRSTGIPEILLSGHHDNIKKWRRQQSLLITREQRPDLLSKAKLTNEDRRYLAQTDTFSLQE